MGKRQEELERKLDEQCELVMRKLQRNRRISPSDDARKVPAADLAIAAGVIGSHEQRRRRVRRLVSELRGRGKPIVSDLKGYWIAENAEDHRVYEEACRKSGLSRMTEASRNNHSQAAEEAKGQLNLF